MPRPRSLDMPIEAPGPVPTEEKVEAALRGAVDRALDGAQRPGILLSGGVDSALLVRLVTQRVAVPTFTLAGSLAHPDMVAARRLAVEWGLEHYFAVPDSKRVRQALAAVNERGASQPGDEAVYLAVQFAADHGVRTLLATDGIDELMGGYWSHVDPGPGPGRRPLVWAFEEHWGYLWDQHLEPLLESAEDVGLSVRFPYLDEQFVSAVTRIPLEDRVACGVTKALWKQLARRYVPGWVVDRPKLGFVSALEERG